MSRSIDASLERIANEIRSLSDDLARGNLSEHARNELLIKKRNKLRKQGRLLAKKNRTGRGTR